MSTPDMPATEPFSIQVEAGSKYFWCACGRSATQPFCDGSHTGTGIVPVMYKTEKARTVFFCGCKRTAKAPLCDGTHASLRES